MRLAVFADIHGNVHALGSCIADALARGAEGFLLLGDFVTDFAAPRQTLDLIYDLMARYPCHAVRGNREGYLLSHRAGEAEFRPGSKSGSLLYTARQLTERDLAWFASLPIYHKLEISGVPLELAHAEKGTDRHVFQPGDPYLDTVFADMATGLLLTGHSHVQYCLRQGEKVILNPGALGIPKGTPGHAPYALVDLEPGNCSFQLLTAAYDVEQAIREQFDRGMWDIAPWWAIGAANNLITGEDTVYHLVTRVTQLGDPADEALWEQAAREMGLALTKEELLDRWRSR